MKLSWIIWVGPESNKLFSRKRKTEEYLTQTQQKKAHRKADNVTQMETGMTQPQIKQPGCWQQPEAGGGKEHSLLSEVSKRSAALSKTWFWTSYSNNVKRILFCFFRIGSLGYFVWVATGKEYMPWIHILSRTYHWLIEQCGKLIKDCRDTRD